MINEIFTSPTFVCLVFSATNNYKLHPNSPTSGIATFSDSHCPYPCIRRAKIMKLFARNSTQYTLSDIKTKHSRSAWIWTQTAADLNVTHCTCCEPVSPVFNDPDCTSTLTLDLRLETSWKSNQNCHRYFKMSCKDIWVNTHLVNI